MKKYVIITGRLGLTKQYDTIAEAQSAITTIGQLGRLHYIIDGEVYTSVEIWETEAYLKFMGIKHEKHT